MQTLDDGIEAMERTVEVLQAILIDETLEFFTGPFTDTTYRAGRRMLDIGPLLYARPRDALHVSLWEALALTEPQIKGDEDYARSLFRVGTWDLAYRVTAETTWDELEAAIRIGQATYLGTRR